MNSNSVKIVLNSPQALYYEGSIITGKVIVTIVEPKKSKYITLFVFGGAKVSITRRQHDQTIRYTDKREAFNYTIPLWTPKNVDKEELIPRGVHSYDFEFTLPDNCWPSYEGEYGHIRYCIQAEVHQAWSFNLSAEMKIKVGHTMDLAQKSLVEHFTKNHTFAGKVSCEVHLQKHTFMIGEEIPVRIIINNLTGSTIDEIEIGISGYHTYKITNGGFLCNSVYSEVEKTDLATLEIKDLDIKEKIRSTVDCILVVTKEMPTVEDCEIIGVVNQIYVKISKDAFFSTSATHRFPITLLLGATLDLPESYSPPPSYSITSDRLTAQSSLSQALSSHAKNMVPIILAPPQDDDKLAVFNDKNLRASSHNLDANKNAPISPSMPKFKYGSIPKEMNLIGAHQILGPPPAYSEIDNPQIIVTNSSVVNN